MFNVGLGVTRRATVSHFFSFSRVNKKCNLYIHTGAKRSTLGAFDMRCTVRTVRSSSRLRSSFQPRARIRIRVAGARVAPSASIVAMLALGARAYGASRARRLRLVRPASRRDARRGGRPRVVVSGPVDAVGTRAAQTAVASSCGCRSRARRLARATSRLGSKSLRRRRRRGEREAAKAELLAAIDGCERGVTADAHRRSAVDAAASRPERLNPPAPRSDPSSSSRAGGATYTTSASILGANKPWPFRPLGPIYQTLDAGRLRASNRENLPILQRRRGRAGTPTGASSVDVQFVKFFIFGLIPVVAANAVRARRVSCHVPTRTSECSRGDPHRLRTRRGRSRGPLPRAGAKIRTRRRARRGHLRRSARRETRWTAGKTKRIPRMPRLELFQDGISPCSESNPVWFVARRSPTSLVSPVRRRISLPPRICGTPNTTLRTRREGSKTRPRCWCPPSRALWARRPHATAVRFLGKRKRSLATGLAPSRSRSVSTIPGELVDSHRVHARLDELLGQRRVSLRQEPRVALCARRLAERRAPRAESATRGTIPVSRRGLDGDAAGCACMRRTATAAQDGAGEVGVAHLDHLGGLERTSERFRLAEETIPALLSHLWMTPTVDAA